MCLGEQFPPQIHLAAGFSQALPPTLGWGIEVPGLGGPQKVILVVGEAAEEEGTTNQDDGGRPSEAIGPVIDVINSRVIVKPEGLCVLHGVDYQGDDLEYGSQCEEASNDSQENKHLGSTQGEERENEADAQDDKATEKRGCSCSSPCVLHEALAAIVVGAAAAALVETPPPKRRCLDVVARLQPAAAGQRDDVEGDGAEQQQGQDPPAALAGQAAAQHVVGGGGRGAEERRAGAAAKSGPASADTATKGRGGSPEDAAPGLAAGERRSSHTLIPVTQSAPPRPAGSPGRQSSGSPRARRQGGRACASSRLQSHQIAASPAHTPVDTPAPACALP